MKKLSKTMKLLLIAINDGNISAVFTDSKSFKPKTVEALLSRKLITGKFYSWLKDQKGMSGRYPTKSDKSYVGWVKLQITVRGKTTIETIRKEMRLAKAA